MKQKLLLIILGSLLACGPMPLAQAQQRVLAEMYIPNYAPFDHATHRCPPGYAKISGIMPSCYEPCDATQGWRPQLRGQNVRCLRCPAGWGWPVDGDWCERPNTGAGGATIFGIRP